MVARKYRMMAALPNHAAKFGWRPLFECRAVTQPIQENTRLGRKVNFAPGKIPLWGKSPRKFIYSIPAQETAKHGANFGWPPLSDVGAVTKPGRETRWNLLGCPTRQRISAVSGPKFTILWGHVEEMLLFKKFLPIVDIIYYALVAKI